VRFVLAFHSTLDTDEPEVVFGRVKETLLVFLDLCTSVSTCSCLADFCTTLFFSCFLVIFFEEG
jgi:hypothetical protein